MTKGWATAAIVLIAALAIGAGLALTGGPGQARKERRDKQRENDLNMLARLVDCMATENRGQLPDALAPAPQCNWQVQLNDPFTKQPYRYQVTSPRSYQLCATFETVPPKMRRLYLRDADGCVRREYDPPRQSGAGATIPYQD